MEVSPHSGCVSGKLAAHCEKGEAGVLSTDLYAAGIQDGKGLLGGWHSPASRFPVCMISPLSLKLGNEEGRQRRKRKKS